MCGYRRGGSTHVTSHFLTILAASWEMLKTHLRRIKTHFFLVDHQVVKRLFLGRRTEWWPGEEYDVFMVILRIFRGDMWPIYIANNNYVIMAAI